MSVNTIDWSPKFETGVAAVDHEHQELISLINDMLWGLDSGMAAIAGSEALGEIYARISAHFALEERTMREMSYAGYADHKADHEQLLEDIRDIMDDYEAGKAGATKVLPKRLTDWFTVHFQTHDAKLHTWQDKKSDQTT